MKRDFKAKEAKNLAANIGDLLSRMEVSQSKYKTCILRVENALNMYIENQAKITLTEIPIEKINARKLGIRTSCLRNAGYTNMAQMMGVQFKTLCSIYGVGEVTADKIINVVQQYEEAAKAEVRLSINADKKDKYAVNIVRSIYEAKRSESVEKKYEPKLSDTIESYQTNLDTMQIATTRIKWLFMSKIKKQNAIDSFHWFREQLESGISNFEEILAEDVERAFNVTDEDAWSDYENNTAGYISRIEKVRPSLFSDIDANYGLSSELAEEVSRVKINLDGLKCNLRRYQEWGVKYILQQKNVLLGDEMGLGKTVEAIAAMVALKNDGGNRFLVVCPLSVLENWLREIKKFSNLLPVTVHNVRDEVLLDSKFMRFNVVLTTYETTRKLIISDWVRINLMVVDEAHYIKNKDAQRSQNTLRLGKSADRLLLMTGTALENNVDEMIGLIGYVNKKIAVSAGKIRSVSHAKKFRDVIAPAYYRRKREDVLTELPTLIENEEWCTLNADEKIAYRNAIQSSGFMGARRVSWNVGNIENSSKVARLLEIIENAKDDKRKVLVFTFFKDTALVVRECVGKACVGYIDGSIPATRRVETIDKFESASAGSVLVCQIQAGGTGLNIQAASVVVICEPQVKPSIEQQAISRSYRMGQSRSVLVYRLLAADTIEERMQEILLMKQKAFDDYADKSSASEAQISLDISSDEIKAMMNQELKRLNIDSTEKVQAATKKDNRLPNTQRQKSEKEEESLSADEIIFPCRITQGQSVTQRVNSVQQPKGGYLSIRALKESFMANDELTLHEKESISPNIVGTAVDYLTRYCLEKNVESAFHVALLGAQKLEEIEGIKAIERAKNLLLNVKDLEDASICNACKLIVYDICYRAGLQHYQDPDSLQIDSDTCDNIRIMVNRSLAHLNAFGPVVCFEPTFRGGYTSIVSAGDGDYLTSDTIWDCKVLSRTPDYRKALQVFMYFLMAKHSGQDKYKNLEYFGIFNPRLNTYYRAHIADINQETIKQVETEVIGYTESILDN